jgi:hypothetical protein
MTDSQSSEVQPAQQVLPLGAQVELVPTLPPQYANHVALLSLQHELILDFYRATPVGIQGGRGEHVGRIILPPSILKGLRDALNEQIEVFQELWGHELPNLRTQESKE